MNQAQIDRVTITGADDSTDFNWMNSITEQFPFVEWGILVSRSQMGSPRFPTMEWMDNLRRYGDPALKLSLHVCGRWVRDICAGDWRRLLSHIEGNLFTYDRIQLNFHGAIHTLNRTFYFEARKICDKYGLELILQVDGANDALVGEARIHQVYAVPLFDLSGGAGVVPGSWPMQPLDTYCGYAGGLGPDNILAEIDRIEKVTHGPIWIDMETKVRTRDNLALDCEAVESVLEQVSSRPRSEP